MNGNERQNEVNFRSRGLYDSRMMIEAITNSQSQNMRPSQPLSTPNAMNATNNLQNMLNLSVINSYINAYLTTLRIVAVNYRGYNINTGYAIYQFYQISRNYRSCKIYRFSQFSIFYQFYETIFYQFYETL